MTGAERSLTVFLDEGTPVMAALPFADRGHAVIYHSDLLRGGASDDVVVATAILHQAVLIALDLDMKRMVRRFGAPNSSERYASLDLIFLGCNEVLAVKRLEHAMSFIENEWSVRCQKAAGRLWLDIGSHRLTSYR